MPSPEEIVAEVAKWIEKAEHDLSAAVRLLQAGAEDLTDVICFHAQQCVEKYIKAVLTASSLPFPKTHDIAELVGLLPTKARPSLRDREQDALTDYATVQRYPSDEEPITFAEARRAVAAA